MVTLIKNWHYILENMYQKKCYQDIWYFQYFLANSYDVLFITLSVKTETEKGTMSTVEKQNMRK